VILNNHKGFLSNEDLIKVQASEIEYLRKELYAANETRQMYLNDITKLMNEKDKDKGEVLEVAIQSFMAVHGTYQLMGSPWVVFPLCIIFFCLGAVVGACI
jgi:hypothetical protein